MKLRGENRPRVLVALSLAALLTGCGFCSPASAPSYGPLTIERIQYQIAVQRRSCTYVLRNYLQRINVREERINAISVRNDNAEIDSRSLDEGRRSLAGGDVEAAQDLLGDLFCVPILVQDNIDIEGLATTGGSTALKDHRPSSDAFVVDRLKRAGGILIAKTNMSEWGLSSKHTVSTLFGTTRNAYALDRVPAGSAGGLASAVAAKLGVVGIGSDGDAGVRGPASHHGLVGLRATLGLVSRSGLIPVSMDRDVPGLIGRNVRDVALVLDVVAGEDPADPYTVGADEARDTTRSYVSEFTEQLDGVRFGILPQLSSGSAIADVEILDLFDAAVAQLQLLGAEVTPFEFEVVAGGRELLSCYRFGYDLNQYLSSRAGAVGLDSIRKLSPAADEYLTTHDGPVDQHPSTWRPPCPDFAEHTERQTLLTALESAMEAAEVDALIYPTWLCVPATLERSSEGYCGDNTGYLVPDTGIPAITVPMGLTVGGLPAGLHLAGRPFSEHKLLGYAFAFEQQTHHGSDRALTDQLVAR